jgi:hypothetical protein
MLRGGDGEWSTWRRPHSSSEGCAQWQHALQAQQHHLCVGVKSAASSLEFKLLEFLFFSTSPHAAASS